MAFFAKAVSENNPIYTNEENAKAVGYPALPAPPTFGFSLSLAAPNPYKFLKEMGIPLGNVLHGEQKFQYFKPIVAGDTITLQRTIKDIQVKKEGQMELVFDEVNMTNQRDELVGKMLITTVIRN